MLRNKIKIVCVAIVASLIASASFAAVKESMNNKDIVTAFYDTAINQKDADAALKYLGHQYVQHNPLAADGAEGLRGYIQFLRANFPSAHSEIKRVMTDGDYVILHVHSVMVPGARGSAIVDIFKLDHGKIVEHWDVIQEIPEKAANANGMF